MGNAAIDVPAATELGILICGTSGGSQPTLELTWGLMLALLRHIPHEDRALRRGSWQETVGCGLAGRTLGLVGLGKIGTGVARVAQAFGMNVIAWSQNLTPDRAAAAGAERVERDDLFRRADVVSVHLRLSDRTRGLIGSRELGLMKPTACLVNTSRGPIVDEAALLEALRKRTMLGAALDVYDREPLPAGHPLLGLDNVVLTPHLGYVTEEVFSAFYRETLENIRAWLAGSPTRLVNPEVLGKMRAD
jgi:phosphoglycerate dehydrogenase-like enzyme